MVKNKIKRKNSFSLSSESLERREENAFLRSQRTEQASIKRLSRRGYNEVWGDEYGLYYKKGKKLKRIEEGGRTVSLKKPLSYFQKRREKRVRLG